MTDPMPPTLSDTQLAILAFLRERIAQDGMPPSQLEICAAFGFRQNATAAYHLRALEAEFPGVRMSPFYRFPAVGYSGPDFLNAAAVLQTGLDAHALNAWLHALEDAHGRDRSGPRYSDRTLDIDIVLFDDLVCSGPGNLRLPRGELRHAFVLKPLADIAPDARHPLLGQSIGALWLAHPDHGVAFERVELEPGAGTGDGDPGERSG